MDLFICMLFMPHNCYEKPTISGPFKKICYEVQNDKVMDFDNVHSFDQLQ